MSPARRESAPTAQDKRISIIIADDHAVTREGIRRTLEMDNMSVVGEAETGLRAVQLVREFHPDVVLMDIRMPVMDGLQATQAIHEEAPQTAVIILSGYESNDDLGRALEAGARGYLTKSTSAEMLLGAVRLVIAGGSLVDTKLLNELLSRRHERAVGRLPGPTVDSLSDLQRAVLMGIVAGKTNKEIASELGYSVASVKNAVQRIIEKLDVSDRTQAAVWAVSAGVKPPNDQ